MPRLTSGTESGSWPTPRCQMIRPVQIREDIEKGHKGNLEEVVALAEQNMWPTPAARDYKGANSLEHCEVNGTGRKHMDQLPNAVAHGDKPEPSGALNPTWVEWLMGWPIGWTSMEPITDIDWRDWKTDPADELPPDQIATPDASARGPRSKYDPNGYSASERTVETYAARTERQNHGSIPRVATGIKHRVGRLKAIGNGQVPQVAAMAWNILNK